MPSIADIEQELVDEFAMFEDWTDRYSYIIDMGKRLAPLDEQYRTEENKVRGCQSQVWLHAEPSDSVVNLHADSDAIITKGLIAMLVRVLSGQPADQVATAKLDFLNKIGMREHLSPTRSNGLDAMVKKIKLAAMTLTPDASTETDHPYTEEQIIEVLRTIYDPEIPVNIYDLGLIYEIQLRPESAVYVKMTLTAPNCPVADTFPGTVQSRLKEHLGIDNVEVDLVFDPPFTKDMMSDAAKLELGLI